MNKKVFDRLFICYAITHILCTMYDIWFYENIYFFLLVLFIGIVCFLITIILYFKSPKLIVIYPAFVFFYFLYACELLLGDNYKHRDFLGFISLVAAFITLINVAKERKKAISEKNIAYDTEND